MLKDIIINLMITGCIWKVHDWATKPRRFPARRATKEDWEKCLHGCAVFVGIVVAFFMICVIYMAVTDLPCFR